VAVLLLLAVGPIGSGEAEVLVVGGNQPPLGLAVPQVVMFVVVEVREWGVAGGLFPGALGVVFATGTAESSEKVSWWSVGPTASSQVGFAVCGVVAREGPAEGRG